MNSGVAVKFGSEPSAELSELHSAALASLKGDIVELSKRLQQTERERDLLEKKLAKAQCEQSHLMREHEDVQERTTLRYEERITELHSIIAELNKKIDRLQGSTIREEDECSELRSELSQSQLEGNEDCRSLDQDQTSVSVPENQSTVVTADVEAGCTYSSTWTGTGRPSGRDPLLRRVPGAVGSRQREEKTA